MPQTLETVLTKVGDISNNVYKELIQDYHRYLISRDTSINYQKDNIKLIHMFVKFIGESSPLYEVKNKETIVAFLDSKRKSNEEDAEQKWITTWERLSLAIKNVFQMVT
ncbi:MAG TPA: hypothetical protein VHJ38_11690 [Nitrososphaeraceae archaeon]|jgi:hypothetical protein|nr:hypothetical protein [Nitrososphaeraceae archaeon]